jgi:hypothetical protein
MQRAQVFSNVGNRVFSASISVCINLAMGMICDPRGLTWLLLRHLLISRPSESVALECFILDMCQRSTHMALMVKHQVFHLFIIAFLLTRDCCHRLYGTYKPTYQIVRRLPAVHHSNFVNEFSTNVKLLYFPMDQQRK